MMQQIRKIIRVNGEEEPIDKILSLSEIYSLIGCDTVDVVSLRDRIHVMIVDDSGLIDGKPKNDKATALYHEKCGSPNTHFIAGDVIIVPDSDFSDM